jgi:hypothetical protein
VPDVLRMVIVVFDGDELRRCAWHSWCLWLSFSVSASSG